MAFDSLNIQLGATSEGARALIDDDGDLTIAAAEIGEADVLRWRLPTRLIHDTGVDELVDRAELAVVRDVL